MSNILVFAGTSEGRRLIELLAGAGVSVCASVTTGYGKTLLPESVRVFSRKLDEEGMATLLQSLRFDCVIDATHPYAAKATENIKAACAYAETRYLRLVRPRGGGEDGCVFAETAQKAAEVLSASTGRALLTTGSKELEIFTGVPDFAGRLFPRVLPTVDSVEHCLSLGYPVHHVIAMQGPFTRELNGAMLRQLGASILVTKESGDAGGFSDKIAAARDVGAIAVVIGRPKEEPGYPFEEILKILERDYGVLIETPRPRPRTWFPLFCSLNEKRVAVFGGGTVAARRAAVLASFCSHIKVVSPTFVPEFDTLDVARVERPYMQGDCAGNDIVLAATDNREVNHVIYEEARRAGIPVNVSDAPEECDFYFPAIIHKDPLVIGLTAGGADHKLVKAAAQAIREQAEEWKI